MTGRFTLLWAVGLGAAAVWLGFGAGKTGKALAAQPVARAMGTSEGSYVGPVRSAHVRAEYVRLGSNQAEGLLYEPRILGPKGRIALVYAFPGDNNFNAAPGPQLARRGYRVLMVNYHGVDEGPAVYAPAISRGIEYLRSLAGVRHVVLIGHSGGGHLVTFYQNVAEHGPEACQRADEIYPCRDRGLEALAKADGVVLLDPTTGAFHYMSSIDPAANGRNGARDRGVDMFSAAEGYDRAEGEASYSAAFARRFYRAQAARNNRLLRRALADLNAIEKGTARFTDDEPFVVAGMTDTPAGARLYQPDPAFLAHTKAPHTLLEGNGESRNVIVYSVRPPMGAQYAAALRSFDVMSLNTTVRSFLANDAIRTEPGYEITSDDIVGVDWRSSMNSTPGNAEGITVPALVMVMTCHYLIVPGEIIFNHLASNDKTFAAVEGAKHNFTACRPRYGDTVDRTFDFVDSWLSKPGRF